MKMIKALRNGLNLVIENYKMVPIIYVVNLAAGLLLAIPFTSQLGKEIAFKGVRDDLTTSFNFDWWSALQTSKEGLINTLRPAIDGGFGPVFDNLELLLSGGFTRYSLVVFLLALVYISIAAFFNGGTLALYADEKRSYSTGRFFSLSGFYYHHLFALALTMVLLFLVIYKFLHPALFSVIDAIAAPLMSEKAVWWLNFGGYLIFALLFVLIKIVFDYAKIILIKENHESSWFCIWLAFKFVVGHPLKTLGLYGLLLLISAAVMLVLGSLLEIINPTGIFVLIILVVLQQIFIFIKIGLRLVFLGSQLALYGQKKTVQVKVKKSKIKS